MDPSYDLTELDAALEFLDDHSPRARSIRPTPSIGWRSDRPITRAEFDRRCESEAANRRFGEFITGLR